MSLPPAINTARKAVDEKYIQKISFQNITTLPPMDYNVDISHNFQHNASKSFYQTMVLMILYFTFKSSVSNHLICIDIKLLLTCINGWKQPNKMYNNKF